MNLAIDIGNSSIKVAVIDGRQILICNSVAEFTGEYLESLTDRFPDISHAISVSVRKPNMHLADLFESRRIEYMELGTGLKLPFKNRYRNKESLGYDRIAAVAGGRYLFQGKSLMIIDAGTAITFDFLDDKDEYSGGAISPGLEMRFRALNRFTERLPLISKSEVFGLYGDSTEQAIISGVQNGILFEIIKYIEKIMVIHPDTKVVMTGGDALFLAKNIKYDIFTEPELVILGLNELLLYNIENK